MTIFQVFDKFKAADSSRFSNSKDFLCTLKKLMCRVYPEGDLQQHLLDVMGSFSFRESLW
jgi:hypothetical protein